MSSKGFSLRKQVSNMYTHGQFSDDTSIIIEAKLEYMEAMFNVFHCMGKASGLFVKETGVKVVLIYNQALPQELEGLDWSWENETNTTKLLGFFIGESISPDIMVPHLARMLEHRLQLAKLNPQSLVVRVKIANLQIISALGYMAMLWTGSLQQLDHMDHIIKEFFWSSQENGKWPRVDYATLIRPKEEGGMGLIPVKHQIMARVRKALLWVLGEGEHTLQWILRAKIANLSAKCRGLWDYAWIFSLDKTKPKNNFLSRPFL